MVYLTRWLFAVALLSLTARCGDTQEKNRGPNNSASNSLEETLSLADPAIKNRVVMFAHELCSDCQEDAESIAKLLGANKKVRGVQLVTAVIAQDQAGAEKFGKSLNHRPNWTLLGDPNLEFFHKYFDDVLTPSVVVFGPSMDEVLYKHQGYIEEGVIAKISEFTGDWELE